MIAEDVRNIASKFANQAWVRYWLWVNHPHTPQRAVIQAYDVHDNLLSPTSAPQLHKEMLFLGFEWRTDDPCGWSRLLEELTPCTFKEVVFEVAK